MRTGKRRLKGHGYLFKRGNIYYLELTVKGRRKKISLKTSNLQDARVKAHDYERVAEAKTKEEIFVHMAEARNLMTSRSVRIDNAWDLFSGKYGKGTGQGTMWNYELQWGRFKKWMNDNHTEISELRDISEDIAEEYAGKLDKDDKLSTSTYNQHRGTLLLMTNTLKKEAGITDNVWESVRRKTEPGLSRQELSEEQVLSLLAKLDDQAFAIGHREEMKDLFHIGIWTGMRLKDCVLLKWAEVNFMQKVISRVFCKTQRHKNASRIPIHPTLFHRLQSRGKNREGEYVLSELAAIYLENPDIVKRLVMKVFSSCGFQTSIEVEGRKKKTPQIGFHSLRHSFVSFCANKGVPLAVVQSIVGHSSPAITRHYTHLGDDSLRQAITALPLNQKTEDPPGNRIEKTVNWIKKATCISDEAKKTILALLCGNSLP